MPLNKLLINCGMNEVHTQQFMEGLMLKPLSEKRYLLGLLIAQNSSW